MSEERQEAWRVANRWLDFRMNSLVEMVPGDPDCEACVLARQYMRALDKIEQLYALLQRVAPASDRHIVVEQLADIWPPSIQTP